MSRRVNSTRRSGRQEQQQEEQQGPWHGRVEENGTIEPMDGFSEYEIERRRTMERNHRRLQELGLVGTEKVVMERTVVKPPRRASRAASASGAAAAAVGVRKSLRTRNKPAPVYTEHTVGFDDERDRGQKRRRLSPVKGHQGWEPHSRSTPTVPPARRSAPKPLPPNSSRNLECNIPMLMERYLGRQFPSFGKAPVMELSTKTCPPKFSRMSGVTEWKNAVFLWVNVDGGTGYTNLFEEDALPEVAYDGAESSKNGDYAADKSRPAAPVSGSKKQVIGEATDNQVQRDQEARVTGTAGAATAAACRRPISPRSVTASPIRGGSGVMAGNDETTDISGFADDAGRDDAVCRDGGGATCGSSTGLRMTWFAGGRMTAESSLIQRLLAGRDPPVTEDQPSEAVDADASSATTMSVRAPACGKGFEPKRDDAGSAVKLPETATTTSKAGEMSSGTAHAPCPKPQAGVEGLEAQSAGETRRAVTVSTAAVGEHGALEGPISGASASAGDGVDGGGGKSRDAVLLFCRLPNEPYVFCGRLGYSKHWAGERPVRFVWQLLDAAGLTKRPDFKAILEAAGIGSADPSKNLGDD